MHAAVPHRYQSDCEEKRDPDKYDAKLIKGKELDL